MISPQLRSNVMKVVGSQFSAGRISHGFSDAEIYRLRTGSKDYALKSYRPVSHSVERLASIHQMLRTVQGNSQFRVPRVYCWPQGDSVLEWDDRLWEISDWLEGEPIDLKRTDLSLQLEEVLSAIAAFHRQSRGLGVWHQQSAGLELRLDKLQRVRDSDFEIPGRLRSDPTLSRLIQQTHEVWQRHKHHLLNWLDLRSRARWPCQWIHGDLRKEHVLMDRHLDPGFIDFGAARIDLVSFDLVRFLGSGLIQGKDSWKASVEKYDAMMESPFVEIDLIHIDSVSTLLSVVHWLQSIRKIAAEGGNIDSRIIQRLVEFLTKMVNFDTINVL